jgi:hypothetical protein
MSAETASATPTGAVRLVGRLAAPWARQVVRDEFDDGCRLSEPGSAETTEFEMVLSVC